MHKAFYQRLMHYRRNISTDNPFPAFGTNKPFDRARTNFSNFAGRDKKDGCDGWVKIAIEVTHPALILIILFRADTPNDIWCVNTSSVFY